MHLTPRASVIQGIAGFCVSIPMPPIKGSIHREPQRIVRSLITSQLLETAFDRLSLQGLNILKGVPT